MGIEELTNIFKKDQEEKRDHIHGLKLLKDKCAKNLSVVNTESVIDNDLAEYFKLKIISLNRQIDVLNNEVLNNTFDKWLIKYRLTLLANSNANNH